MDERAISSLVATLVSVILQAVKDHIPLRTAHLKWVAAVLGAIAGGGSGYLGGGDDLNEIIENTGLAAVITTGVHSLLMKDSRLGRMLKALGAGLFGGGKP